MMKRNQMIEEMRLTQLTSFLGRNGDAICSGFAFAKEKGIVEIAPLTSKNALGQCRIEIPDEDLGKFCRLLQRDLVSLVLQNIPPDYLPALLGLDDQLDALIAKELGK
jgi:hypothetical protein